MKTLILVLLCFLFVGVTSGQTVSIKNYASYRATSDTSASFTIPQGNISLFVTTSDTFNFTINLDYRTSLDTNAVATYAVVSDSTNWTTATGKGYVLRADATNNIPGAVWGRLRITPRTTKVKVLTNGRYSAAIVKE